MGNTENRKYLRISLSQKTCDVPKISLRYDGHVCDVTADNFNIESLTVKLPESPADIAEGADVTLELNLNKGIGAHSPFNNGGGKVRRVDQEKRLITIDLNPDFMPGLLFWMLHFSILNYSVLTKLLKESKGIVYYEHDLEGTLLGFSGSAPDVFHYAKEELKKKNISDLLDDVSHKRAQAEIAKKRELYKKDPLAPKVWETTTYELNGKDNRGRLFPIDVVSALALKENGSLCVRGFATPKLPIEQLEVLFKNTDYIYYRCDEQGRTTFATKGEIELLGNTIMDDRSKVYPYPEDRALFREKVKAAPNKRVSNYYCLVNTNTLGRQWITTVSLSDEKSETIEGIYRNVTEEMERDPQAYLITREIETPGESGTRVIFANEKARDLLGLDGGAFQECNLGSLVMDNHVQRLDQEKSKTLEAKTTGGVEVTPKNRGDHVVQFDSVLWPYMKGGVKWFIKDVTELAAAQEENTLLATALKQMTDGVCIYTTENMEEDGLVFWKNERFDAMFGTKTDTYPRIMDLFPAESQAFIRSKLKERANCKPEDYYEVVAYRVDNGKKFTIEISSKRNERGDQTTISVRDVTDKKKTEKVRGNLEDLDATYQYVFGAYDYLLEADLMLLYLFEETRNGLCLRNHMKLDVSDFDLHDMYVALSAEEQRQIRELKNNDAKERFLSWKTHECPFWDRIKRLAGTQTDIENKHLILLPLHFNEEVEGVILALAPRDPKREPQLSFRLEELVPICSRAIENALTIKINGIRDKLVGDIRYREGMEAKEFYQNLVKGVSAAINVGAVTMLMEDGDRKLHFKASTVRPVSTRPYSFGEGVTGKVAQGNKTMTVLDLKGDERVTGNSSEFPRNRTRSFLAVPLHSTAGVVVGVLRCVNNLPLGRGSKKIYPFGYEEIRILESIATGIASFVVNFRAELLRHRGYLMTSHEYAASPMRVINANNLLRIYLLTGKGSPEDRLELQREIDALAAYMLSISDGLRVLDDPEKTVKASPCQLSRDILEPAANVMRLMFAEERPRITIVDKNDPHYLLDKGKMLAAVLNIFTNSIKYHDPAGQSVPTIFVDFQVRNGELTITFGDNGLGIRNEEREVIFDMGTRGGSIGKHVLGHGFGLAIVRTIFKAHGGDIYVTKLHKPTVFTATIPASRFIR